MIHGDKLIGLLYKFIELNVELTKEIRDKNRIDEEEERLHHLQYYLQPFDAYYDCEFVINWS